MFRIDPAMSSLQAVFLNVAIVHEALDHTVRKASVPKILQPWQKFETCVVTVVNHISCTFLTIFCIMRAFMLIIW